MRRRSVLLLVLAGTNAVDAEPAHDEPTPWAIAVNNPIGWAFGDGAASGYVGFGKHVAVRANVASYIAHESLGEMIWDQTLELYPVTGRINDVGLGVVWYPRRLWSGPTVELGALVRSIDTAMHPDSTEPDFARETTVVGARALVGWSWTIRTRGFVAAGIGLSVGREYGETFRHPHDDPSQRTMVERVRATVVDNEFFLRFGYVFDLR